MYENYTKCLPEKSLDLTITSIDRALLSYIFPVQFVIGFVGNLLILWVIDSDKFKNRANDMLAAVSFADLVFLVLMLPHSLAAFKKFERSLTFRLIYLSTKQTLGALANWMSASAIWLILAVSVERLLVIRRPLRSRFYWKKRVKYFVLLSIFAATGVLTTYHHFEYDCQMFFTCNGAQLSQACYSATDEKHPVSWMNSNVVYTSPMKRHFIWISTLCNALLVVFIPIVLVVVLNTLLVWQLHISENTARLHADGTSLRAIQQMQFQRQKYRVTVTVVAIAFSFSITQGPSAIMVLWELRGGYASRSAHFLTIFSITNTLVVFGKMTNFALFWFFSSHFRRKFIGLIIRKFPKV
ncbi:unnamed protein product [Enterobius vermicularis]|uniref:G_PROTEIN_RECEP_F1_2 domain-containing protein n=1 Tax=Enterobius vermicularis TaxID=51028 RepID=A0A0N4V3F9_ENTVE|nr:unnamed protein product [Enterobius vermicularis]